MENSKSTQILIKQLTKENIKLRNRIRELERTLHSSEKLTTIPAIHKIKTKDTRRRLKFEAAREKINHFLRKFILFFVSLFVTLFHFLKSDVTVAFYFTNYI